MTKKIDERWLVSRRALLGGVCGLGAAGLLPARSAKAAVPPRLLVVHVPEGMWSGAPRPAPGASSLGPIFEALDPFKAKLTALLNLNMASRDHGPGGDGHHRGVPHMFTGTEMADESNAGGPSVDQKIAQAVGGGSQFASLQLAARIVYGDTNARPIWSAAKRAVPALQDPWDAYQRIFSNVAPVTPTKPKLDLRKSALDHALSEMASLRSRLAAADRERLDTYQASLRSIEKRLATTGSTASPSCTPPSLGGAIDVKAESNYPKVGKLQMDLIHAAFQCGLTRVASLQWGNSNDQCSYSFLGVNALGHDLAHNNGECDNDKSKKLKVYRWYAEQFAYLLGRLEAVPEGEGTMLDNTLVLWASEFSDSGAHAADRLLWLLMGNAGGALRQGRILDCAGRSVNDLHTLLCEVFGIGGKFGNPAYCSGALDLRA